MNNWLVFYKNKYRVIMSEKRPQPGKVILKAGEAVVEYSSDFVYSDLTITQVVTNMHIVQAGRAVILDTISINGTRGLVPLERCQRIILFNPLIAWYIRFCADLAVRRGIKNER